jgi:Protein of unknown function (DUF1449)
LFINKKQLFLRCHYVNTFKIKIKKYMLELINASFAAPNLLVTVLLLMVVLYWLTVVVGALDMDSFHVDTDIHHDISHLGDSANSADFFIGILRFFGFGKVPFMVNFSILWLIIWSISIYCNNINSFINPEMSILLSAGLFVPNVFASLFITKFLTFPLAKLFDKLHKETAEHDYIGKIATVTTNADGEIKGQAKLTIGAAALTINVKTIDGSEIQRGEEIIIVDIQPEKGYYLVQKLNNQ